MDPKLQAVVESWLRTRNRVTSCMTALDTMLLEHPELAPLQLELQVLRREMLELAESITVIAATLSAG